MSRRSVEEDPIQVLIVTDRLPSGESLAIALDNEPGLSAVGIAEPMTAVAKMALTEPDVVVIDAAPHGNGMASVPAISERYPQTKIVVVIDPALLDQIRGIVEHVSGLLSASSSLSDLLDAIKSAANDGCFVDLKLVEPMAMRLGAKIRPAKEAASTLTPRELEVLSGLAEGLDLTAIAHHLGLSTFTIRGHVRNILKRLGVHSQLQAVVVAQRLGLIRKP